MRTGHVLRRIAFRSALLLPLVLGTTPAFSEERHFARSQEAAVLSPGAKDVALWVTPGAGRADFYARFDSRAQLALGLSPRLQTALALDFTTVTAGSPDHGRLGGSAASEWKLALLDSARDGLGLAVLGAVKGSLDDAGLEARVILDRRLGEVRLALNLAASRSWAFGGGAAHAHEQSAGLSYQVTPHLAAGLEAHHHAAYQGSRFFGSALFAGPALAYAGKRWWLTALFAPQIAALRPGRAPGLELEHHERFTGRVLLGFKL